MPRTALYPGSFDPFTNGHAEIVRAAFRLCDRLVVALGAHPAKAPMLPAQDRLQLIEAIGRPMAEAAGGTLEVRGFDNLVVDFAREVGATLIVRGLRDGSDLDYEMHMAGTNAALAPEIQTVFIPAAPATRHITATLVRQIASLGGDVRPLVPETVATRLAARFSRGG